MAQHPDREVAYSNLAEAQLARRDTAGAITTMQALLAIGPSPARRDEAETLLGRLGADMWDTQEWDDAQQAAQEPVEDGAVAVRCPAGEPVTADTVVSEGGMTITQTEADDWPQGPPPAAPESAPPPPQTAREGG